jgi:hypothetical protein
MKGVDLSNADKSIAVEDVRSQGIAVRPAGSVVVTTITIISITVSSFNTAPEGTCVYLVDRDPAEKRIGVRKKYREDVVDPA